MVISFSIMLKKLRSKGSFSSRKGEAVPSEPRQYGDDIDDGISLSTLETGTMRSRLNDAAPR